MSNRFALAVLFASSLAAQQKLEGRSFVPPEPSCEVWVDLHAMRETGVWDGISRSLAGSLLPMIERQLGFRIDEIDRLRGYPATGPIPEGESDSGVFILEGSDGVLLPDGQAGFRKETIGGHEVLIQDHGMAPDDPNLMVAPKSGVLVFGARHVVEPVLLGKRAPGVTPPELLSLSAARGVLAHVVMACDETAGKGLVDMARDAAGPEIPAPPAFLMVRMRFDVPAVEPTEAQADKGEKAKGDANAKAGATDATAADEGQVHLDGTLRWANAEQGPQQFAVHLRLQIAGLKLHPRMAALKRLWNLIEVRVDGRDVHVHVPLGRPRDAGGAFAMVAPFLLMTGTEVRVEAAPAQSEAPAAEPAPQPAPEPAPQPAAPPKPVRGNGGQGQ